jgi:hypothetical protein
MAIYYLPLDISVGLHPGWTSAAGTFGRLHDSIDPGVLTPPAVANASPGGRNLMVL